MSSTDSATTEVRDEVSPTARNDANRIRRMAIKLTRQPQWGCIGHLLLDNKREAVTAEVFSGIGFYARPRADSKTVDAVVVHPGGASNPIIVATRDEDVRRAIADIEHDESIVFNSTTVVMIRNDGTVEIRLASGTALALPTLADHQALVNKVNDVIAKFNGAILPVTGSNAGPPSVPVTGVAPNPTGTTVLKAQ